MTNENDDRRITLYSYRKVWFIEKKIYAVQNIVLPVPVNPYEILEFIGVVGIIMLFTRIVPALENVPPILRYAAIPYLVVKYLMKLKLDGKNPVKYFVGLIPYIFTKTQYIEHFKAYPNRQESVKLNWFCSRG